MASVASGRLRLGVIGLGRAWDTRHRPALERLGDRVEVTTLYDQVTRRAEIEAIPLDCRASAGLVALVSSPAVDALAWLAPQWFEAHPVALAIRWGKPIYCGVPWPDDPAALDRIEATLSLGPASARIFWPAAILSPADPLNPSAALATTEATLRRFVDWVCDPSAPWDEALTRARDQVTAHRDQRAGREP